MKIKILIGLIVLAGLSVGGFFVYKNFSAPEDDIPEVKKKETPEEQVKKQAVPPEEKAEEASEGSRNCVNDDDCVVFGKTGDCNCGCYNKSNLPSSTGGECFCAAPTFCKCINGECEGVFEEKKEEPKEEKEELEAGVKYTSEGLVVSGEFVDVEAFQLPDGSYAMHLTGSGRVAYSPDGLAWTISEDKVIGEGSSILKLPDGGYRAWWSVPKGGETFDMLTAFSSDGYNWGKTTMLTSSSVEDFYGALPAVVISPDGTYRMYYTRTGPGTFIRSDMPGVELQIKRIYSAHSLDGLFWEPDSGIRIDGGEEADKGHASSNDVYVRKDGKYEMVYNSGNYGIGVAVSDDGLNWTRLGSTGLDGADPFVNVFSDGTVRMYYAVYIPEFKKQDVGGLAKPAGVYSAVREPIEK